MKIIKIKRKRAPYVIEKQIKTQKVRLNRLRRAPLKPSDNRIVIMDDESYYPFHCNYNDFY